MLVEFAVMNHERGWAQQLHVGALRDNNQRMFAALGPDTGYDSIGDWPQAQALSRRARPLGGHDDELSAEALLIGQTHGGCKASQ